MVNVACCEGRACEAYDARANDNGNKWQLLAAMKDPRRNFSLVATSDYNCVVIGGLSMALKDNDWETTLLEYDVITTHTNQLDILEQITL